MKITLQLISFAGLLLTIIPPVLYFNHSISHSMQNWLMVLGAIIWFASAGFWMGKKWKNG